ATVVGIPGRVVVMRGQRVHTLDEMKRAQSHLPLLEGEEVQELEEEFDVDLDHCALPDPEEEMRQSMLDEIHALERKVAELEQKLEEKHAESL
ncbi:MAG: serine O-acetyltransferase, partial [Selenomonadaceae bacterium]|nr:serine O-acetyltransferase [Selenomonadaceae bacterium]